MSQGPPGEVIAPAGLPELQPPPVHAPRRDVAASHRRSTLLTAGTGFAVYGLSLATGPLLSRTLGPAGRGDLAAVLVPFQLFVWLAGLGLPQSVGFFALGRPRRQLLDSVWAFTLVVVAPLVALLWWAAPWYLHQHDPATVAWLRVLLVVGAVQLPASAALEHLNATGNTGSFNRLRHLGPLGTAAGLVVLAVADALNLASALSVTAIAHLSAAVAVLCTTGGWPGGLPRLDALREQLHYGSRVVVGEAAHLVVGRLDQLVMVGVVRPAQLGLYAVAATASGVSGSIGSGISLALFPRILHAVDESDRRAATRQALRWMALASVGMAVTVGLAATMAVPLLFGAGFAAAVPALWLLLPGQVCADLAAVLSARFQADGRPAVPSRGQLVAAAITVTGVYPAVRLAGIAGAAVVTTISQLVLLGYLTAVVRRPAREPVS